MQDDKVFLRHNDLYRFKIFLTNEQNRRKAINSTIENLESNYLTLKKIHMGGAADKLKEAINLLEQKLDNNLPEKLPCKVMQGGRMITGEVTGITNSKEIKLKFGDNTKTILLEKNNLNVDRTYPKITNKDSDDAIPYSTSIEYDLCE